METIKNQLTQRMKDAMRSGDARLLGAVRFVLSELQRKEKEKFTRQNFAEQNLGGQAAKEVILTHEEEIAILQKEAKKRRESMELYKKGGRDDLAEKEGYELGVIESYLPKQMSRGEIEAAAEKVMAEGAADFNAIMKETMKRVAGRADGKTVSEVIKGKLGS